ncbi:unnamed protein product [Rotaria socialis]|uniref:Uncharacterized protein n=1 Tax=Rotaria socialis TaxID=392032 RepID=A0A819YZQ6_9BILA|nr:unnamed protein product [Rotaria socialis]
MTSSLFNIVLLLIIKDFDNLLTLDELCSNVSSTNSTSNISQAYTPLRYSILKTLVITNPCDTDKSILIRNKIFYKYDREQHKWKRLCIAQNLFDKKIPIVNSIAHLNNDLILIINGVLFRTQNVISSVKNNDIIYRLKRYINLPILFDNIDYVFTTPCCTCLKTPNYRSISHTFNDYILLANQLGNVILFNFKSVTIVYNFGNIFQFQSVCESNQCRILHLGLSHSIPSLLCFIQYETGKAVIVHQSFLNFNSTIQKSTYLNFIGDTLYIAPSTYHNSYFIWDENRLYYTTNGGLMLSEVIVDGCHFDYLENMNENQLKNYYTNLNIDYDNITLITKQIYCLFNQTIDYIFISNNEFFIMTKHKKVLYGKESLAPSMINLKQEKRCSSMFQNIENQFLPGRNLNTSECLLNFNKQSLACSMFVQSSCSYISFKPLFDINRIYVLEKNHQKYFKFILEAYTMIPIIIISTKSMFLDYSINYTINRMNTGGIIQIIGDILVSTTNKIREMRFCPMRESFQVRLVNHVNIVSIGVTRWNNNDHYDSSLITIRLELIQYSYSCNEPSSFSFQVEASCASASVLRIEKNADFEYWNESNPIVDIEWIRKNLPANAFSQVPSVYIKRKQIDSILLNYQYCLNQSCQSIKTNQLDFLLIYAIPISKHHENYARYLINRSDSCISTSQSIYRLWLKWTLNITARNQLFPIPHERRTFYRTLLNTLAISNNSCLLFNGSNPLHINDTINQASHDYLNFVLHIIAYNNKFSFGELETFVLIEIEPMYNNIYSSYRGFIFLIAVFLCTTLFMVLIHIYTYYKQQQRKKHLEYHRLHQIDAGQLHQWYDIAHYLNANENNENYVFMCNYLSNLKSTTSITKHLMEYRT